MDTLLTSTDTIMKPIIKGILIFALGGAAGATGGFFFAKKFYKEKAEKDIEEFKEYWLEKWSKDDSDAEHNLMNIVVMNSNNNDKNGGSSKSDDNSSQNASKSSLEAPRSAFTDYSGYSIKESKKTPETALKSKIEAHPVDSDEDDNTGENVIVGDDDAGNLPAYWHEIEVDYYMGSKDLVDRESNTVMDIANTVTQKCLDDGPKWLERNGLIDRDFIFVNSPKNQCTYIVNYLAGSSSEDDDLMYDDTGGEK